jgi:uncharacterized protein CbrC (UPF0167 family)
VIVKRNRSDHTCGAPAEAHAHPDQEPEQIDNWVRERTAELEQRTPTLVTWQDFFWPAHCGDYCCFLKEVGKPDLSRIAPDGDGQAFFVAHLLDADNTDVNSVWLGVREDSPDDNSVPYDIGVYLFCCLHCGQSVIMWDGT